MDTALKHEKFANSNRASDAPSTCRLISTTILTMFLGLLSLSDIPAMPLSPNDGSSSNDRSSGSAPIPQPLGDGLQNGEWVFQESHSDEFNASKIDRSRWNIDSKDFGPWSWEPENVTQQDGVLTLQMVRKDHQRGNQKLFYTSGMARIDEPITYGYFEARIKGCDRYPGACPSFWLYSSGPENRYQARDGETVAYSEIDVVELQQSEFDFATKKHFPVNRIDCNLHTTVIRDGKRVWLRPHSHPEICRNLFNSEWDPRDDYHVYAVENSRDEIVWYIDGQEVARKPNLYWHLPMHLTLSLGLRYPFVAYEGGERVAVPEQTTDEGFPTSMSVDYVRVWQRAEDAKKKSATDWTKAEYIASEKAKWEKNGWRWDAARVESNFEEIDSNNDGLASGKERQAWFAKKARETK